MEKQRGNIKKPLDSDLGGKATLLKEGNFRERVPCDPMIVLEKCKLSLGSAPSGVTQIQNRKTNILENNR